MIWFYVGCVMKYGQPFEVKKPPTSVDNVDFSDVERQLNTRLLSDIPTVEQERCQRLEQLIIRAKSWEYRAQSDLHDYIEAFLSDIPLEDVKVEELTMETTPILTEEVLIEDMDVLEEHPYIALALEKEQEGEVLQAFSLLEKCHVEDCWGQVYVTYRAMQDRYVQMRIDDMQRRSAQAMSLSEDEAAPLLRGIIREIDDLQQKYAQSDGIDRMQKMRESYEKILAERENP
ncbi:MAG: hypothetical protein VX278_16195 [Myxococcota bacterium]|nr:hypothetical protein [Myxococcota bacterium]